MEKRVHKDLVESFKIFPEMNFTQDQIPAAREVINQLSAENPFMNDDIHVSEEKVLSKNGAHSIRVKIYEPKKRDATLPGIFFIHGGGFVVGTAEYGDAFCYELLTRFPAVIVSVEYRLAPETPYPGPLEDCYEGLEWFAENSENLGVDRNNIAVVGQSAGGGLAAAVSLLARDRKGPSIVFQMPLYPMLDDRVNTPSSSEFNDRRVWNTLENKLSWDMYLAAVDRNQVPVYAAPARADDYSNLPPTYTCIGELDPFRDETIEYISNLSKAGVPIEFHLYPGCFHAFEAIVPDAEVSQRAKDNYFNALSLALTGTVPSLV